MFDIETVPLKRLALFVAVQIKRKKLSEQGRLANHQWKIKKLEKHAEVLLLLVVAEWFQRNSDCGLREYCRYRLGAMYFAHAKKSAGRRGKRRGGLLLYGSEPAPSPKRLSGNPGRMSIQQERFFLGQIYGAKAGISGYTKDAAIDAVRRCGVSSLDEQVNDIAAIRFIANEYPGHSEGALRRRLQRARKLYTLNLFKEDK